MWPCAFNVSSLICASKIGFENVAVYLTTPSFSQSLMETMLDFVFTSSSIVCNSSCLHTALAVHFE